MSAQQALLSIRGVVLKLFPALAGLRVRPVAEGGALALDAASDRLELLGGGPAVGRVGDTCGRLVHNGADGVLYYSPSPTAAYSAIAFYAVPGVPPPSTPGTSVVLATGSEKVTCG